MVPLLLKSYLYRAAPEGSQAADRGGPTSGKQMRNNHRRDALPRALGRACSEALRETLDKAGAGTALPFVEATVLQAAHPLGTNVTAPGAAEREWRTANLTLELLLDAVPAVRAPSEDAAARLRAEPRLLAAFFQNIDLLYQHGFPYADAVSGLVLRALEEPR
jgi:hypothetical protein